MRRDDSKHRCVSWTAAYCLLLWVNQVLHRAQSFTSPAVGHVGTSRSLASSYAIARAQSCVLRAKPPSKESEEAAAARTRREENARKYVQQMKDLETRPMDNMAGYNVVKAVWARMFSRVDNNLGTNLSESEGTLAVAPFLPIVALALLLASSDLGKAAIGALFPTSL
eukprot:TRINITY_DN8046_c0_g1_i1.p1 TRINITY_DN8046_c0_g1~~TRINITY_DN8046_c0_g1_i1.p1  ORF type:complete len:168 (+),score=32.60 TRINITY_DN8046_c0_g1_i1:44-547(+)